MRTVVTEPDDKGWPKNITVLVPYCERCGTVAPVTECVDDRIPEGVTR